MAERIADQRGKYPLASYNFRVTVADVTLSFTEVSGLVREYKTLTYQHGLSHWEGESIVKFRQDKYTPLTLKKGMVAGVNSMYQWLDSVDKRNMSVALCDEKGTPVVTWQIQKALLVKLDAPTLQAGSNEAAIESLTLMVSGVSIKVQ